MNLQLSIIVPVYNVEKYLHRCMESLLAQNIPDYEIILVDDGSKDRSPESIYWRPSLELILWDDLTIIPMQESFTIFLHCSWETDILIFHDIGEICILVGLE